MKKLIKYIILPVLITGLLGSCHKLNLPVTSELTPGVFPQDSSQYASVTGPVYVVLRGNYAVEYFFQQTYSTDEGIMPARGGNWYDGAQNQQMHYHTWDPNNNYVNTNWVWCSTIIGVANQAISILNASSSSEAAKQVSLAEVKMSRALAYFFMMDNYGNLPIDTLFGDYTPHANVPRAQVFSFIESEIKAVLPYLNTVSGISQYGRPNKYTAYALLAKMYLNAEYYTGTARYNDCIAACDSVINSGLYSLQSMSTYLTQFAPTNGPQCKEFIFAIPYDPSLSNSFGSTSWPFRGVDIHSRYDVPRSMGKVANGAGYNFFNLPFTPDGPASTLPSFYANFNDAGDIRNKQWLTGLQFEPDGVTPLTVTTTKGGYDFTYTGADASSPFTYQVNLTPDINLRYSVPQFDVGNDEIGWTMGYRNIKFYPDATSSSRNQNNDIPVFRYSDILLEKAEAILRGGNATGGQTALSLVNELRAQRTTTAAWNNITLDSVYNERCREFAWESWHRNDMIRYGKFEQAWGFKTDADVNHRIFPIPTSALVLDPKLTQNPGY
jgi:starch-binding outer membrane protein, SusD/RagB family